ncbi:MAG: 2-hydroxyacid dehydrogenase, partial [Chitinophagaceae bacterium]
MTVTIFSTHAFEKATLTAALGDAFELRLLAPPLNADTAALAAGSEAVCLFVNDDASAPVLRKLAELGVRYIVLRSAGYNNVDLEVAKALGMR